MKIVTINPFWVGKKIAFGCGVGSIEFDENGCADLDDEHFEYMEQHGVKEKTLSTDTFSLEKCTPEDRKAIFLKLDIISLQVETKKLAEVLGKKDHEWVHLKLNSLASYLVNLWDEVDDLGVVSDLEKPKKDKKQKTDASDNA